MTDLSKGRILVTGGAGFIGSALVWELNRRGLQNILIADFLGHDEK
jgi:ADP-L-glycero-D-manno-heptose 6-epimerase